MDRLLDINPKLFQPLQDLTKPHIDSFNALIHGGLSRAVQVKYLAYCKPTFIRVREIFREVCESLFIAKISRGEPVFAIKL